MTDHTTAKSGVSQATVARRAGRPARPGSTWWTLVAVCLGMFMLLLDITIVTVALPGIQRGLGCSFSGLQWIVDAYTLTLAAILLTAGSLSDMYGRRLPFLIGLAVFTGARATQVAGAVQSGQTGRLIAHPSARTGHAVAVLTRTAFTAGLNQILLVAAIITFASGLISLAAIRGHDFVAQGLASPGR